MFAITELTSLGSALLPLMWGWAIAAHTVAARAGTPANTLVVVSTDESDEVRNWAGTPQFELRRPTSKIDQTSEVVNPTQNG